MGKGGRPRALLAAAFLCALAAAGKAAAQAPPAAPELDPRRAVILAAVEDGEAEGLAARFAEALAEALAKEAAAAGYDASLAPGVSGAGESEVEAALRASAESGARWAMIAGARLEGTRVLWRASVYDGSSGSLMGADSFSAYAGLSALSLIGSSAANAVKAASSSIALALAPPSSSEPAPAPIDERLRFAATDEGAVLRIGDRVLGTIEGGGLEAPYIPFATGSRIAVGIEKDGYWPRLQTVKASGGGEAIRLKPLFLETRRAFGASWGTGRILGAAASYRLYLLSDRIYARAEDSLWAAYDFSSAARPVLHDELRLGLGAYLLFDPLARFRVSAGTGISLIGTLLTASEADPRLGLDFCLEPLFYTLEWHEPSWALVFEARYPYSTGASLGFLRRGWLSLGDAGPQFYSIGVLFKR